MAILAVLGPRGASAATDANVRVATQAILAREYARGDFAAAQRKLVRLLQSCGHDRCSASTEAQVWMALGLVSIQQGQLEEGTQRFATALRADPDARPPSVAGRRDVSREAMPLLEEARREVGSESVAPEPARVTDDAPEAPAPPAPPPVESSPEAGPQPEANYLTPAQIKCMLAARSQDDLLACLPQNGRELDVRAALATSGYTDTNHVNVLTPAFNGSIASPTAGWNLSASYLVDVVSAASPDIVSEASPPFHEVRQAGSLGGGFKGGPFGVQLDTEVSSEPDYLSVGGGAALTADLDDKLVTPSLGLHYTHDTIGRSTTPFSVFHHNLDTAALEGGTTLVLSPTSILLVSGTLDLERGDQSKPYRYVPMFASAAAASVTPGASIAFVNQERLAPRPLEQLPLSRDRYALGARLVHRFGPTTLRVEERLYTDSWQQSASTTDLRWLVDLSRPLRVWLHGRFNAQNAANFYRLAYAAEIDPATGRLVVPAFRTDDRELGRLTTVTGGPGLRLDLGTAGRIRYGLSLQGDVMYSRYFDSLFIRSRTAIYGTLGFDAELE